MRLARLLRLIQRGLQITDLGLLNASASARQNLRRQRGGSASCVVIVSRSTDCTTMKIVSANISTSKSAVIASTNPANICREPLTRSASRQGHGLILAPIARGCGAFRAMIARISGNIATDLRHAFLRPAATSSNSFKAASIERNHARLAILRHDQAFALEHLRQTLLPSAICPSHWSAPSHRPARIAPSHRAAASTMSRRRPSAPCAHPSGRARYRIAYRCFAAPPSARHVIKHHHRALIDPSPSVPVKDSRVIEDSQSSTHVETVLAMGREQFQQPDDQWPAAPKRGRKRRAHAAQLPQPVISLSNTDIALSPSFGARARIISTTAGTVVARP